MMAGQIRTQLAMHVLIANWIVSNYACQTNTNLRTSSMQIFHPRSIFMTFVAALLFALPAFAERDARNQVGVDPFDPTTKVYLSPSGIFPHGDGLFTVVAHWETDGVVRGIGLLDPNGAIYIDRSYSYSAVLKSFLYDCKENQYGLVSEDYFLLPSPSVVFSETVDDIVMYDLTPIDPLVATVCG